MDGHTSGNESVRELLLSKDSQLTIAVWVTVSLGTGVAVAALDPGALGALSIGVAAGTLIGIFGGIAWFPDSIFDPELEVAD